jgi:hypothetical protein
MTSAVTIVGLRAHSGMAARHAWLELWELEVEHRSRWIDNTNSNTDCA